MSTPPNTTIIPLTFGQIPCKGAKCIPFKLDFSAAASYELNFSAQLANGSIDFIQTMYVDNTLNLAASLFATVDGSQQTLAFPQKSLAYMPILAPQFTRIVLTSAGTVVVYVAFMNFYVPPTVWAVP